MFLFWLLWKEQSSINQKDSPTNCRNLKERLEGRD